MVDAEKREIAEKKPEAIPTASCSQSGVSFKENQGGKGADRERLSKMRFCLCGGCFVMESGVVDVRGAERKTDCRCWGRGEGAKGSG